MTSIETLDPTNAVTIDPTQIITWIHLHQWAPLLALIVGLIVRLVKDDTKLPAALPAVWRAPFALLVSMTLAGATAILGGMVWQGVVENGLIAFVVAILGHETIIEGARGGVEIPIPWLTNSPPALEPHVDAAPETPPLPPVEPPKAA